MTPRNVEPDSVAGTVTFVQDPLTDSRLKTSSLVLYLFQAHFVMQGLDNVI